MFYNITMVATTFCAKVKTT